MKRLTARRILQTALPAFGLLFAGCGSLDNLLPQPQPDLTRYYTLTGQPAEGPASAGPAEATPGCRVGLRIDIPEYLHGRQIVVRNGSNELILHDSDRWAEPLQSGIERTLSLDLAGRRPLAQVVTVPFPMDAPPNYVVSVTIDRCEGTIGDGRPQVHFSAEYRIETPGQESRPAIEHTFVAPDAAWDGRDFARLAALLSADIAALGRDIAGSIPASTANSVQ